MRSSIRFGVAAVALCIGLAGCGSDTNTESSPSAPDEIVPPTAETSEAVAPAMTLAEYIQQNDITETPVRRGDPGTPTIDLPLPEGWRDVTKRAREGSYLAMENVANPADPSTIVLYVAKLTGNVDAAKILEYAPAEIQRLPGYQGPRVGGRTNVGGFDATEIGALYDKNGVRRAIGQMTAVVPGQDGLFVLQFNATGPAQQDSVKALAEATAVIAREAKITI